MSPMVVRSTPESFIHAWSTDRVSSSGRPQENPITSATSMRRLITMDANC
jgi:hypothetical protein